MQIDMLAVGAHPDDIELSCGGTIAKLVREGHKVAMVDLTQGELGTRGNKEIRAKEAEKAAKILGVEMRRNLKIEDGNIRLNRKNLLKVVTLIRELRPKILLIPYSNERHPDHVHTHHLCKEAWFFSGLEKIKTKFERHSQEPFRPENYFCYMQRYGFIPTFVVDVTGYFEIRLESIRAHASQFHNPKSKERETILSKPDFIERIETRARYFGLTIGVRYGEPFYSPIPLGVKSIFDLVLLKG